jgi:hypothetical protein
VLGAVRQRSAHEDALDLRALFASAPPFDLLDDEAQALDANALAELGLHGLEQLSYLAGGHVLPIALLPFIGARHFGGNLGGLRLRPRLEFVDFRPPRGRRNRHEREENKSAVAELWLKGCFNKKGQALIAGHLFNDAILMHDKVARHDSARGSILRR